METSKPPRGELRVSASLDELIVGIKSAIAWASPDQLSLYYIQSLESCAKDVRIKLESYFHKKDK